jgi:hypothetical protein
LAALDQTVRAAVEARASTLLTELGVSGPVDLGIDAVWRHDRDLRLPDPVRRRCTVVTLARSSRATLRDELVARGVASALDAVRLAEARGTADGPRQLRIAASGGALTLALDSHDISSPVPTKETDAAARVGRAHAGTASGLDR